MAETHVVSALRDKRAELSGLIRDLEKRIGQYRVDLVHLDATLRLFAPDVQPEAIPARRPARRNDWFKSGECARLVCNVLRDAAAPMPTAEIARRLMETKGLPPGDERTRALVQKTILGTLNRAGATVERLEIDKVVCWRVVP